MGSFLDYSRYYNLLYKDKDYQKESNYIEELIRKHNPSATRLLDVGCGTGVHAKLFAAKGFVVHGIDLSESMLDEAKKGGNPNLTFSLGNIQNFEVPAKFDVITSLFHVMSYQTTNAEVESSFKTVLRHLQPNGIFIFDVWYGPAVMHDLPTVRVKRMEDADTKVVRISEPVIDFDRCIVNVNFDVNVIDKQTNQLSNIKETHPMRFFFMNELELIASYVGFEVVGVNAWLTNAPPSRNSWYAVVVCKRST